MCLRSIKIVIIFSIAILLGSCYVKGYSQEKEPATGFQYISPIAIVNDMNPGWNLGNTLDAIPTEGAWNNPPVETYVFDDAQKAGFKSVRLPVTWAEHIGPAPDYKVDPKWFDRVEQVVDWAIERDMYIMVNAHHDSWNWLTKWATNPETHERYVEDPVNTIIKFEKLWEQIAERFKNKNEKLIFEVINEPDGSPARVNEINHRRSA